LQYAEVLVHRVGILSRGLIEPDHVEQWNPLHHGILVRDADGQLVLSAPMMVQQIRDIEDIEADLGVLGTQCSYRLRETRVDSLGSTASGTSRFF
jgi:hypothetical protein